MTRCRPSMTRCHHIAVIKSADSELPPTPPIPNPIPRLGKYPLSCIHPYTAVLTVSLFCPLAYFATADTSHTPPPHRSSGQGRRAPVNFNRYRVSHPLLNHRRKAKGKQIKHHKLNHSLLGDICISGFQNGLASVHRRHSCRVCLPLSVAAFDGEGSRRVANNQRCRTSMGIELECRGCGGENIKLAIEPSSFPTTMPDGQSIKRSI